MSLSTRADAFDTPEQATEFMTQLSEDSFSGLIDEADLKKEKDKRLKVAGSPMKLPSKRKEKQIKIQLEKEGKSKNELKKENTEAIDKDKDGEKKEQNKNRESASVDTKDPGT